MRRAGLVAAVLGVVATLPGRAAELPPPVPSGPRLGACGLTTSGFLLPGTEACLTLDGSVRAEGGLLLASPVLALAPRRGAPTQPSPTRDSLTGTSLGTSARLSADIRLPTELGPARIYVSLRGHNGRWSDAAPR